MREVQAPPVPRTWISAKQDVREKEEASLSVFFKFPLPIVPVVSLLNGMGAAATVNIYLYILIKIH